MIRILFFAVAFFSLFAFPWHYAAILAVILSLFVPLLVLAFGILTDVLYYTPGALPIGTLFGLICFGIAFFASRFIRSRVYDFLPE